MKTDDRRPQPGELSRRTTLKTLVVGGGTFTLGSLPAQWVKPVVDAVLLPAHAQTSEPAAPARTGFEVTEDVVRAPSLLDRLIRKAHAGTQSFHSALLCIDTVGATGWAASYDDGSSVFTTSGTIGSDSCVQFVCGDGTANVYLKVTKANPNGTFNFELFLGFDCEGDPDIISVTNTPCSLIDECVALFLPS